MIHGNKKVWTLNVFSADGRDLYIFGSGERIIDLEYEPYIVACCEDIEGEGNSIFLDRRTLEVIGEIRLS